MIIYAYPSNVCDKIKKNKWTNVHNYKSIIGSIYINILKRFFFLIDITRWHNGIGKVCKDHSCIASHSSMDDSYSLNFLIIHTVYNVLNKMLRTNRVILVHLTLKLATLRNVHLGRETLTYFCLITYHKQHVLPKN